MYGNSTKSLTIASAKTILAYSRIANMVPSQFCSNRKMTDPALDLTWEPTPSDIAKADKVGAAATKRVIDTCRQCHSDSGGSHGTKVYALIFTHCYTCHPTLCRRIQDAWDKTEDEYWKAHDRPAFRIQSLNNVLPAKCEAECNVTEPSGKNKYGDAECSVTEQSLNNVLPAKCEAECSVTEPSRKNKYGDAECSVTEPSPTKLPCFECL
jgi:hypothetical protein